MKLFAKSLIVSSALLFAFLAPKYTATAATQGATDVKVQVNDTLVHFPDAQPFLDNSHNLQVPVRFLSNQLGFEAKHEVIGSQLRIELKNQANIFIFTTGDNKATLNGSPFTLKNVPQFINGRVFISFRDLADTLKIRVQWDPNNRVAILDEDNQYHAPAWYAPRFEKILEGKATAYTSSPAENGGQPGIDYFGNQLQVGTISVDPSVIPLGSKVYIEGYNYDGLPEKGMYAMATDTGGAIKGNKIDIFVPDSKEKADTFGIQQVKIYVIKN